MRWRLDQEAVSSVHSHDGNNEFAVHVPVIGNRTAVRYGNDDTLEADANYYNTHDTSDICAWKSAMPSDFWRLIEILPKRICFWVGWRLRAPDYCYRVVVVSSMMAYWLISTMSRF